MRELQLVILEPLARGRGPQEPVGCAGQRFPRGTAAPPRGPRDNLVFTGEAAPELRVGKRVCFPSSTTAGQAGLAQAFPKR